jgi:hypothetical protein
VKLILNKLIVNVCMASPLKIVLNVHN